MFDPLLEDTQSAVIAVNLSHAGCEYTIVSVCIFWCIFEPLGSGLEDSVAAAESNSRGQLTLLLPRPNSPSTRHLGCRVNQGASPRRAYLAPLTRMEHARQSCITRRKYNKRIDRPHWHGMVGGCEEKPGRCVARSQPLAVGGWQEKKGSRRAREHLAGCQAECEVPGMPGNTHVDAREVQDHTMGSS